LSHFSLKQLHEIYVTYHRNYNTIHKPGCEDFVTRPV